MSRTTVTRSAFGIASNCLRVILGFAFIGVSCVTTMVDSMVGLWAVTCVPPTGLLWMHCEERRALHSASPLRIPALPIYYVHEVEWAALSYPTVGLRRGPRSSVDPKRLRPLVASKP